MEIPKVELKGEFFLCRESTGYFGPARNLEKKMGILRAKRIRE